MNRTRVTLECKFSQSDFDDFAAFSGDDNPIHTDPAFSARSRFGRTAAHGVLLLSVVRGLIDRLVPDQRLIEQEVMFPAPTFTGELMRFSAERAGSGNGTVKIRFEARRMDDGEVTCQGHCEVRA